MSPRIVKNAGGGIERGRVGRDRARDRPPNGCAGDEVRVGGDDERERPAVRRGEPVQREVDPDVGLPPSTRAHTGPGTKPSGTRTQTMPVVAGGDVERELAVRVGRRRTAGRRTRRPRWRCRARRRWAGRRRCDRRRRGRAPAPRRGAPARRAATTRRHASRRCTASIMHVRHVTRRFQSIAPDVVLGEGATVHEFVNLYGCTDRRVLAGRRVRRDPARRDDRRHCKISTHSFICSGVHIADRVFVGHGVTFVNDKHPRACNADGTPKGPGDWTLVETWVEDDAVDRLGRDDPVRRPDRQGRDGRRRRGRHPGRAAAARPSSAIRRASSLADACRVALDRHPGLQRGGVDRGDDRDALEVGARVTPASSR